MDLGGWLHCLPRQSHSGPRGRQRRQDPRRRPRLDMVLQAAGAQVSTMPSNERYIGMQTGALDAARRAPRPAVSGWTVAHWNVAATPRSQLEREKRVGAHGAFY